MTIQPRNNYGFADKMKEIVMTLDDQRKSQVLKGVKRDLSLNEYIAAKYSLTDGTPMNYETLLNDLGVEPNRMTVDQLLSAPIGTRYLVPEIIREAIRKGLRRAPIHPNLVRSEESVAQPTQTMPYINFSGDADMNITAEAEQISEGTVSYGSKDVKVYKRGRAIKITYEAIQFTTLNLVDVFFEDVGVRLGHTLDAMAIDCIINGDQADGSESAPEIGVEDTADGITYYDLLRVWIRGGLIGRSYRTMVGDETSILTLMNLSEYKTKAVGVPYPLDVKVPIIQNPEIFAHINVPSGHLILQDKDYSLVQLTAMPLLVETEKIVMKQIEGTVASIMTGFAKLFRDSSLVIDSAKLFSSYGFPDWMVTGYTS